MWSQVIIPILTMIIGIVCGASAMDMYKTNRWMQKIDRKALRHLWENRDFLSIMNPVVDHILSRRSIRKFHHRQVF